MDHTENIRERLKDFDPEEIVEFLEIGSEELVEMFAEKIDEDSFHWLTAEPYSEVDS